MLNLYTIGYTEKTAEYFFSKLKSTSAKTQSGKSYAKEFLADSVLLCSEKNSECCHRRLAAEYLNRKFNNCFSVIHLV